MTMAMNRSSVVEPFAMWRSSLEKFIVATFLSMVTFRMDTFFGKIG